MTHGLRAAELVDLRWEQIDLEYALLHRRRYQNDPGLSRPQVGSSIRCVTPSWRLPASRACSGLKTKTLSISFEEFLEPKSRPPAVANEESRSTPPGSIYPSIDLDKVVIFCGKFS